MGRRQDAGEMVQHLQTSATPAEATLLSTEDGRWERGGDRRSKKVSEEGIMGMAWVEQGMPSVEEQLQDVLPTWSNLVVL